MCPRLFHTVPDVFGLPSRLTIYAPVSSCRWPHASRKILASLPYTLFRATVFLFGVVKAEATEDAGPGLLDEFATIPLSGVLQAAEEFFFFFDKVALRGPGPLVVVQLPDLQGPARIFDDDPTLRVVSDVPGLVAVRPRRLDAGASYELVFGPGAVQDSLGNMAHSSKEFEA
ncbi:unnamed protein product [Effrenium voratum]|nr:unnamed protein product [Effrenium voratum]